MKKILFIMYGAISHINPTIILARKLQKRGYQVIYAIPPSLENYMKKQGLEYYVQAPFFLAFPLHYHIFSRQQLINFKQQYLGGTIFKNVLDNVQPELIILDTAFINSSIELRKTNIPVFIAQLWCSVKKKRNLPPIHSYFMPDETLRSKLKVEWLWLSYFLRRRYEDMTHRILYKTSEFKLLKEKLMQDGLPTSSINFKSYFHIGVNFYPEVIFPPKQFDFQQAQTDNEIYLGYEIDQHRNEGAYHEKYEKIKQRIFEKPTCYCSSGSLFSINKAFVEKLCSIFKDKEDLNLILHVGSKSVSLDYFVIPPNVFVFEGLLPQLEILNRVQFMMTHGGMNTIMECINYGVPMIVFPESLNLDQVGNAARVQYHKIGLSASVYDSIETIAGKIDLIEKDGSFRENIKAFKEKIYSKDGYEPFLNEIDVVLNPLALREVTVNSQNSYA